MTLEKDYIFPLNWRFLDLENTKELCNKYLPTHKDIWQIRQIILHPFP